MVEGWIIEKRKKKSNQVILSLLLLYSKSVDRLTTLPLSSLQIKAVDELGPWVLQILLFFIVFKGCTGLHFNQLLFSLPSTVIHGSCFWAVLGKAVLRSHISHANIHAHLDCVKCAHLDCVKCVSEVQLIHNGLRRTLSERNYTGFHTVGSLAGPSFSGDCRAKHFKWILKIGIKGIGSRGRDLQEPLKKLWSLFQKTVRPASPP